MPSPAPTDPGPDGSFEPRPPRHPPARSRYLWICDCTRSLHRAQSLAFARRLVLWRPVGAILPEDPARLGGLRTPARETFAAGRLGRSPSDARALRGFGRRVAPYKNGERPEPAANEGTPVTAFFGGPSRPGAPIDPARPRACIVAGWASRIEARNALRAQRTPKGARGGTVAPLGARCALRARDRSRGPAGHPGGSPFAPGMSWRRPRESSHLWQRRRSPLQRLGARHA